MNNFYSTLMVIFAYLLGSIPFGYFITKISTKKNILEIGWRKTSGSNVFKNVGKWQGILTGIFDILKGYLAIFLAKNFGFSPLVQILSGVAAITGHNWSIFLKFAGGRGIGTFIGAFLALSPKILWPSLVPFVLLGIIWNLSIGTILFLICALILSIQFQQFETAGIFTLISLLPIFLKRLSPMKELSLEKKGLIRNRLIFDNDELCLDLRMRRIIKNLTKT
jgi:glycerol-3-phosphate acyltransferase PlsY